MKIATYRSAALLYLLFFLALIWPYWLKGEVVSPHRQQAELARQGEAGSAHLENHRFSDATNAYLPEITMHLGGPRSAWLALWTPQTELGRPLYHISGFSPAYLPAWLLSRWTQDPWKFFTVLALSTCLLAGAFMLLFCREAGLAPIAGLFASVSLAAAPPLMYWLSFPMFVAVWCWSAAALWSITRLYRRPDVLGWSALAFSAYSLLLAGYPQLVVFHAYLIGGYGLHLTYRKYRAQGGVSRFVVLCASASAVGVLLTMPVYRDLWLLSSESARVAPDPSFFTAALPTLSGWADVVRFLVLSTTPEVLGNPIAASFPLPYNGLSLAVPTLFFAVAAWACAARETWGWWLAIGLLCLFAFDHSLYVFGVEHLGFHLSRNTPIGSTTLPLVIVSALGVHALTTCANPGKRSRVLRRCAACCAALLVTAVLYALSTGLAIHWPTVLALALAIGLLSAQTRRMHPVRLGAAVAIAAAASAYPLMLRQDPLQIATTSPLAEEVRRHLPAGSRFSVAAPGVGVLPPNLNASLGLPSLHSYNSLSPRRYHRLIAELGEQTTTYGRWNGFVAPDYGSTPFWMSNVAVVLSPRPVQHENLALLGQESTVFLYRVVSRMGRSLQVVVPPGAHLLGKKFTLPDPRTAITHVPTTSRDQGDAVEFTVTPGAASLLVLSQKFHRDWHAYAWTAQRWAPVPTVEVNGVFQGAWLPAHVQQVRWQFRPWASYSWIGHLVWSLLCCALLLQAWRARRTRLAVGLRQG